MWELFQSAEFWALVREVSLWTLIVSSVLTVAVVKHRKTAKTRLRPMPLEEKEVSRVTENPQVEKRSDFDVLAEYCRQHGLKHKMGGKQADVSVAGQQKTEPHREKPKLIRRIPRNG